jgi:prepilin-type N-terminal cleavage/methylation domain-containing protein
VPHPDPAPRRNGFTLVEVLVALVVTSFVMAILFNGALSARDRGHKASQKTAAIQLAGTLATEATVGAFAPGVRSGDAGTLKWQVSENAVMIDPRGFFALAEIQVAVTGSDDQVLYRVVTRKLKPVPQT